VCSFHKYSQISQIKRDLYNRNLNIKHNTSYFIRYIRLLTAKTGSRHLHLEKECCFLELEVALKLRRYFFLSMIEIVIIIIIIIIGLITYHKNYEQCIVITFSTE
jgi:hypothetical protein